MPYFGNEQHELTKERVDCTFPEIRQSARALSRSCKRNSRYSEACVESKGGGGRAWELLVELAAAEPVMLTVDVDIARKMRV